MKGDKFSGKFAIFLVIFLLVSLPVATAVQLSSFNNITGSKGGSGESQAALLTLPQSQQGYGYFQEGVVGPQISCGSNKVCGSKCWLNCPSGNTFNCYSNKAYCCSNNNPYYWGGFCHKCPKNSNECGGSCFGDCPGNYKFSCESGKSFCRLESCNDPVFPYKCDDQCWSLCSGGGEFVCKSNGVPDCISKCTDKDGDGYGNNCNKGSDCNDNNININPGRSETCNSVDDDCDGSVDEDVKNACGGCGSVPAEVCNDGKDNDCDGNTDGTDSDCCPSSKPYYLNGQCRECPAEKPNKCGSGCYSSNICGQPGLPSYNCKSNGEPWCCPKDYPYYCEKNSICWKNSDDCSKAQKCGSEGWTLCLDSSYPNWNCRNDGISRCCPNGYPYLWNSDKQCHTSKEPPKCLVPDGSSANCDCDTDSECAKADSSKPFCGEGGSLYDVRAPQGFHACLSSKPEYCGDGKCEGSETYSNCVSDCGSLAPKGTITTEVVYYGGSLKDKPVQGAYVYLDGVSKGNTGNDGKLSFQASYGSRTVKVECPDSTFCDSITINLAASTEYKRVRCTCNPPGDLDNDGFSDEDERLLGTDPKKANSNFGTTFASDSVDLLACVPTPASFFILWKEYKKGGSIINSHSLVVNSLNVTSVTSTSLEENPVVVAQALSAAGFEAEGAEVVVNPANVTLESVMKAAEYVDGVRMQDGILLIATDKDGQTTALIAIGAGCAGAFSGAVYGIGQGLFDDVRGVIDGIWFVITHLGDVKKVWSGVQDLVTGVIELLKSPGETVWTLFRNILEKGQGINLFREGRLNQPEPYRHFQVGFVYGFVTGYVVEQVVLGKIVFGFLAKTFKGGQLLGKTGKAAKLMEKLEIVKKSEEFGAEIAEKLSKLKYIKESIENWLDSEIKGLARIVKHNEGWLKGLTEAEAKIAAKHADELTAAGKVSDAAFGDLTKTKLGQHTLKSSDATTELLAKQSKLVEKWGVKKADDVISKGGRDAERINDLNKVLKAMPKNLIDDFSPDKAVKFLGDKKLVEATEKLSKLCNSEGVSSSDFGPAAVQTCLTLFTKIDEFEDAVKGAKVASLHIDDLSKIQLQTHELTDTLQKLGKIADVDGVKSVKGPVDRLTWPDPHGFNARGAQAEILRGSYIKSGGSTGQNLVAMSKRVKATLNGEEVVQDADIISDFTFGGKKTYVLEEVKRGQVKLVDVEKQFERYGKLLKAGDVTYDGRNIKVSKIRVIITKGGTITDPARQFAESNGFEVLLWEV